MGTAPHILPGEMNAMVDTVRSVYQICVPACEECIEACTSFTTAYRDSFDPKLEEAFALCRDCADVCNLLLRFLDRGSTLVAPMCRVCEAACTRCAAALEATGDDHCSALATACHTCAQACRTSAGADV